MNPEGLPQRDNQENKGLENPEEQQRQELIGQLQEKWEKLKNTCLEYIKEFSDKNNEAVQHFNIDLRIFQNHLDNVESYPLENLRMLKHNYEKLDYPKKWLHNVEDFRKEKK